MNNFNDYGYISIEEAIGSIAAIAIIAMVLYPIFMFFSLLVGALRGVFNLIENAVKGGIHALIQRL